VRGLWAGLIAGLLVATGCSGGLSARAGSLELAAAGRDGGLDLALDGSDTWTPSVAQADLSPRLEGVVPTDGSSGPAALRLTVSPPNTASPAPVSSALVSSAPLVPPPPAGLPVTTGLVASAANVVTSPPPTTAAPPPSSAPAPTTAAPPPSAVPPATTAAPSPSTAPAPTTAAPPPSTAPAPTTAPACAAPRPTVLLVGDSVALGAKESIGAALAPHFDLRFDAAVSRSTWAGAGVVAAVPLEQRRAAVIHLGHNDGADAGGFRARLQAAVDAAAGSDLVLLLTVAEVRDYYADTNQVIRAVAAARPGSQVVEWGATSTSEPGFTGGDGLHLSTLGAQAMAGLLSRHLEAWRVGLTGC
jgi:lysophospholipase L1-like esterase